MGFVIGLLYVVEVLACLLLAGVVMLQKPKEGGLGGVLGGGMGEAVFGADAGNILIKATAVLGTVFIVNTLVLASLTAHSHKRSMMSGVSVPVPVQEQAVPAIPAMPSSPSAPAPAAAPAPAPAAAPAPAPAAAPATPAPAPAGTPAPAEAK